MKLTWGLKYWTLSGVHSPVCWAKAIVMNEEGPTIYYPPHLHQYHHSRPSQTIHRSWHLRNVHKCGAGRPMGRRRGDHMLLLCIYARFRGPLSWRALGIEGAGERMLMMDDGLWALGVGCRGLGWRDSVVGVDLTRVQERGYSRALASGSKVIEERKGDLSDVAIRVN